MASTDLLKFTHSSRCHASLAPPCHSLTSVCSLCICMCMCYAVSLFSCPAVHAPLVENVWWFDANFLSLTPFSSGMWHEQWNLSATIKSCYIIEVIEVQKGRLDCIPRFAIIVRKRELCASALPSFKNWVTTNLLTKSGSLQVCVKERYQHAWSEHCVKRCHQDMYDVRYFLKKKKPPQINTSVAYTPGVCSAV